MKKQILLLAFLLLAVPMAVLAQNPKAKVTAAAISFEQDLDYDAAITKLKEALADPSALDVKTQIKAYSMLGRSYAFIYTLSNQDGPKKAQHQQLIQKYPNFAVDAYKAFSEVIRLDTENRTTIQDKAFYPQIAQALLVQAFEAYQQGNLDSGLEKANMVTAWVDKYDMKNLYTAHLVKGFILVKLDKYQDAVTPLERCLEMYKKQYEADKKAAATANRPTPAPDENIRGVYVQLVEAYGLKLNNIQKMQAVVEDSKRLFPNDENINKLEIHVYSQNPELLDTGIEKARKAVEANPNDAELMVQYANLLKNRSSQEAIDVYAKALAVNPNHFTANFNIGALYNNVAKEFHDQANANPTSPDYDKLMDKKTENLKMAYKYMKAAYLNIGDGNRDRRADVLRALVNITGQLADGEEMMKYKRELDSLGGN